MKIKINKVIKKGRALRFHCESYHGIPFFFFLCHLLLGIQLTLKRSCFSCEVPLEEMKVSFAIDYQLEMVSGLVMEACVHISFKL